MPLLNFRNLHKPKTLLLLGGAFGFVALFGWSFWNYRLMLDRTASAPAGAVSAVSLRQPLPEKLAATLPDDLVASLAASSAYATRSATGAVEWHPLSGSGHWRIVSRDVGAVGFAVSDGKAETFSAKFNENSVALRVGKGFRGLNLEANHSQPRLIKTFPAESYLYLSDAKPSAYSAGHNNALGDIMANLNGRMELMLAQHGNDAFQPFLIIASPGTAALDFKAIDQSIAQTVGKLDPADLNVILPDSSKSKEMRNSFSEVKIESRKLSTGSLHRFIGPSGKLEIDYFSSDDGSLWISNHLEIIQGFIVAKDDSSLKYPLCTGPGDRFTAVIHPKADSATGTVAEWIRPWSKGFDSVVFSLKQEETGLFTLCGYL